MELMDFEFMCFHSLQCSRIKANLELLFQRMLYLWGGYGKKTSISIATIHWSTEITFCSVSRSTEFISFRRIRSQLCMIVKSVVELSKDTWFTRQSNEVNWSDPSQVVVRSSFNASHFLRSNEVDKVFLASQHAMPVTMDSDTPLHHSNWNGNCTEFYFPSVGIRISWKNKLNRILKNTVE